ncbi:MAG TPA: quinone-dependent dihydroorotate dehydrogenase [Flavisolibacter sp.]|nr:quinone-dependent dihydroorotate dehydrogenase [Flavisolibacter sp.]
MYKLLRNLLFLLPAETAHYFSMNCLRALCAVPFIRSQLRKRFTYPSPHTTHLFNLQFKNKVGLGAGFDKNAKYLRELEALGFGFVEIGTVTPKPQAGNDQPRLFRLKKDNALINRMGFNNDGVEVVAARLREWRCSVDSWQLTVDNGSDTVNSLQLQSGSGENAVSSSQLEVGREQPTTNDQRSKSLRRHKIPTNSEHQLSTDNRQLSTPPSTFLIGGNIGKNKATPNEDAWKDYEICFTALHPYVDFFVVNVSSPNTPGLRELQEKEALRKILTHLQKLGQNERVQKPILLKIAPDLSWEQIDDVIQLATEIKLDGLVASNTTVSREGLQTAGAILQAIGLGGLSGKPLQQRSTEVVQYIHQKTGGALPIIGSGGIFNGDDALKKIEAGASLVEVWTGFIYEGPFIVRNICRQLEQITNK